LAPVRDGSSLSILECEKTFEPRCVCASPSVMWEGEYFCVVTGDLIDKCAGRCSIAGSKRQMNSSAVFENREQQNDVPRNTGA
jgi:hypothetical protein